MSHVFLVRNTSLKRLVAIKVLRGELAADPVNRKRFVREAQAAARISHPNVTSVYAVGTLENDTPFIEMQYIEGRNLAQVLRSQGRLDVPSAIKVLAQLSEALAAAHACRVIHRNVKPTNVLIESGSNTAFLTDFGIAGILESGSESVTRLTREGDRLGDPTYMSPEQLRAEVLTPQSDIYGLGILGYEMLTLAGPFGDSEITSVSAAHLRRAPIDLHDRMPSIPRELSNILKRCLSKQPENRPESKGLARRFAGSKQHASENLAETQAEVPLPRALTSFMGELRTRKVYRAAVAYAAMIFVVLQVADLVLPALDSPGWLYKLLVIASLAGFPLILALAWVYEWHEGRLRRTEDGKKSARSKMSPRQRHLLLLLGLALSIALSAGIAGWLLKSG